jgi:hypothetical protein
VVLVLVVCWRRWAASRGERRGDVSCWAAIVLLEKTGQLSRCVVWKDVS